MTGYDSKKSWHKQITTKLVAIHQQYHNVTWVSLLYTIQAVCSQVIDKQEREVSEDFGNFFLCRIKKIKKQIISISDLIMIIAISDLLINISLLSPFFSLLLFFVSFFLNAACLIVSVDTSLSKPIRNVSAVYQFIPKEILTKLISNKIDLLIGWILKTIYIYFFTFSSLYWTE